MTTQDMTELNIYMGIDTLQVRSDSESSIELESVPFISKNVNKTPSGYYLYRLNPDKANGGLQIYNSKDYYTVCDYMISALELTNPVKVRIDFRFDSFDDNFNELLKLNSLLELLLDNQYQLNNRYKSNDLLTFEQLTVRIQNKRLEVENYNKGIQEPNGIVKNRLELRSKALTETNSEQCKEYAEFLKWCDRLKKAVTKENFDSLMNDLATMLYVQYLKEHQRRGFTLNKFLYKYSDYIYSNRQLALFYMRCNNISYETALAKGRKYKCQNDIELLTLSNMKQYIKLLVEAGKRFFETYQK